MDPIIFDEFLPKNYHVDVKNLLESDKIDWRLLSDVAYTGNRQAVGKNVQRILADKSKFLEYSGFVALLFLRKGKQIKFNDDYLFLKPFQYLLEEKLDALDKTILGGGHLSLQRCKVNCLLSTFRTAEQTGAPHIDSTDADINALYYIDDTDGDTYIYIETVYDDVEDLTVKKIVKAKANRLVVFSNSNWHSGTPPKQSKKRITVNFNYTIVRS